MRLFLPAAVLLVTLASPALASDPLICVRTGATTVGPYTVDPPDPCVL